MAEDPGKQEEKLEFTGDGETLGYISLDQARVLAMRTARETPGAYGQLFLKAPMAFEVVEAEETEDHYVITLSFRPQGEYAGRPGREQFFIEKEGTIAHRQVLALPKPRRKFPIKSLGFALAVLGVVAIILVFVIPNVAGDSEVPPNVGVMSTDTPEPATGNSTPTTSPPTKPPPGPTNTGQAELVPSSVASSSNPPFPSVLDPPVATQEMAFVPINHQGGLDISSGQAVAQVFTSPSQGVLTGVEIIGISRGGCVTGEDLEIRLLATDQGLPGSLVFYSEILNPSVISEEPGNIEFEFGPNGWTVGQYESLALVLSSAAGPGGCS